jgi:hypothetical protein
VYAAFLNCLIGFFLNWLEGPKDVKAALLLGQNCILFSLYFFHFQSPRFFHYEGSYTYGDSHFNAFH